MLDLRRLCFLIVSHAGVVVFYTCIDLGTSEIVNP